MATKENKTKQLKWYTAKVSAITVLVCALVAGLIIYHILAVKNAEKHGYLDGIREAQSIQTAK